MLYSTACRASRRSIVARAVRTSSRRGAVLGPLTTTTRTASMLHQRPPHGAASFSSGAATDGLVDILKREHDEEKENQTSTMPDDLQELHKTIQDRDWKIVDEGATTRLFSTIGSRKVQILFHCQDTLEEEYQEEEGEEVEEEPAPTFRYTVTVSKAGKTMVFVCLSKDAQCTIESVNLTKTDVAGLDNGVPAAEYQGPEFYELATDLQDAFGGFLHEEIGIDQDMNAFIAMYADYKEQTQYVEFLESAQGLLS